MILIPEIETVVILVPRTGTKALRRAVQQRYPRSMLVYRHMEADGVPLGYDRWRRVGVVQDVGQLHAKLDVRPSRVNGAPTVDRMPVLTGETLAYAQRCFAWDFAAVGEAGTDQQEAA